MTESPSGVELRAAQLADLAARAAHLRYREGKTNIQIAEELGISRLRVPKLLQHAEDSGIVRVEIQSPHGYDADRAEQLRSAYGLAEALIPTFPHSAALGQLVARYLREVLVFGAKLGMSWGASVEGMVTGLEGVTGLPRFDAVQLIGGIPTLDGALHASGLLARVSAVSGGEVFALHAPMVLPNARTVLGLRSEGSVARAFEAMQSLDAAVIGVGSWQPPVSRVWQELPDPDRAAGVRQGVVADLCGIFLTADGSVTAKELSARMVSIDAESLRATPVKIAVAMGAEKVPALRAAMRSGLVNVLATDAPTADALVAESF
jgi:DNA-binding transcriptional regulator LsrR (DeoR family)